MITTFLFFGVFFFGYFVAFNSYQDIAQEQQSILSTLLSLEAEKDLIQGSCKGAELLSLSKELQNMGAIIGLLEDELGKENSEVIEQKKIYTILQVEHLLFIQEKNDRCNKENPIILFFYSNEEDYLDRAEEIGYILSNKKSTNPEVMIYSFDYDLESSLIKTLKTINGVDSPNTVLVNGKIIPPVKDINDLNSALEESASNKVSNNTIVL